MPNEIFANIWDNTIHAPKKLNLNGFYAISRALRNLLRSSYDLIVIDFGKVETAYADGILPLGALLREARESGKTIRLIPPRKEAERQLFKSFGWYDHLVDSNQNLSTKDGKSSTPIQYFGDFLELNKQISEIVSICLKRLIFEQNVLELFEWSLNEISGNIIDHSGSDRGAIQIITHPEKSRLTITVFDSGMGIPRSMREHFQELRQQSDSFALQKAMEKGVTSKPVRNQGLGLAGSLAICQQCEGRFAIASGNCLIIYKNGELKVDEGSNWIIPGTLVDIQLPTNVPLSLDALGIPSPAYSILEEFNFDDGIISLNLAEHFSSLGNRKTGLELRLLVRNLLEGLKPQRISLDFSKVRTISSSCADEFLGKLAKELGAQRFKELIVFKDITENSISIVSDALNKRIGISDFFVIKKTD